MYLGSKCWFSPETWGNVRDEHCFQRWGLRAGAQAVKYVVSRSPSLPGGEPAGGSMGHSPASSALGTRVTRLQDRNGTRCHLPGTLGTPARSGPAGASP